jgi:hypothetical protein
MMRTTLVLAAVLGAALIVGCGGGGEEAAPPPEATALTPADLVAELPALAITSDDVPAGFTLVGSGAVPNEAVAEGDPFPEQRLQELEETGRVSGYQVVFQTDEAVISAVLSVYGTAEGAQQSLDQGVRFGPEAGATAVDAPDVGLPGAAWQIDEQMAGGLKGYVMLARKGRINVSLSFGEVAGAGRDEVEELLRTQIARLGDLE